jgi:hypothetical protein
MVHMAMEWLCKSLVVEHINAAMWEEYEISEAIADADDDEWF